VKVMEEVFLYSWCEDFVQSESPARTHDKSSKSNALFPAVHVDVLQSTSAPDEQMQQIWFGCTHGVACSLHRGANDWPPFSDYPSCIALSLSLSPPRCLSQANDMTYDCSADASSRSFLLARFSSNVSRRPARYLNWRCSTPISQ
jgi:hypothetical protein